MGGFRHSYFFISLGLFIIRMTKYYFSLLLVNLLSVKLFLKLHMNIVKNLLSTTLPSSSHPFSTWSFVISSLCISSVVTLLLISTPPFYSWKRSYNKCHVYIIYIYIYIYNMYYIYIFQVCNFFATIWIFCNWDIKDTVKVLICTRLCCSSTSCIKIDS